MAKWKCGECALGICELDIVGSTPECCIIDGSHDCKWEKDWT